MNGYENTNGLRVWKINDGETTWIVADLLQDAITLYESVFELDEYAGIECSCELPGARIRLSDDSDEGYTEDSASGWADRYEHADILCTTGLD